MHAPGSADPATDELSRLLRDALAPSQAVRVEGPLRRGRYSHVYRAEVDGLATRLVVKRVLDPARGAPDPAAAVLEYEALDRVWRAMQPADPRFRVPKPYAVLEGEAVVVAEWIDGVPMTALLLDRATSLAEGRDLVGRAAGWLARFHVARPMTPEPLDVARKLADLDAMERAPLASFRAAREAFALLRRCAPATASVGLARSWLHGDFKADNLLVAGPATVAIDVHARFEGPVAQDLAAFAGHLDLVLCDPRAWRWRRSRAHLETTLLRTLDPGYLAERRLPYRWLRLYGMLGVWEEFLSRRRAGARHLFLSMCFRSLVRRLTAELADAARDARG